MPLLATLAACSFVSNGDLAARLDLDADGVPRPDDCDDDDAEQGAAQVWYADGDGDGYGATASTPACEQPEGYVAEGGDCDDQDAATHPGTWWYPDADGDTYGNGDAGVQSCEAPPGHLADGSDCDDQSATAYPGGSDEWYDGIDGDCLGGSDFDRDGDGYDSDDYGGTDCVDDDAAIFPGAGEVCSNRIDDDCDGVIAHTCAFDGDVTLDLADAVWVPTDDGDSATSDAIWNGLAGGQLLGNGRRQLALSVPEAEGSTGERGAGAVYVVDPEVGGNVDDVALAVVRGVATTDCFGISVATADLDADGTDDLLVGSPCAGDGDGEVAVFYGPLSGEGRAADHLLAGANDAAGLGTVVEAVGDIDGDGIDDAIASTSDGSTYDAVLYGGRLSTTPTDGVSAMPGVGAGRGDVDGDGQDDLLFGGYFSGGPRVFTHAPSGIEDVHAAEFYLDQTSGQIRHAVEILPDTNGDGFDDVWLGAPGNNNVAPNAGAGFLVLGPAPSTPVATVYSEVEQEQLGYAATGADVDGDGLTDLLLANPTVLHVVLSPVEGSIPVTAATARIESNAYCTRCYRSPGDLDGDGADDLLVAKISAYLFHGGVE